MIFKSVIMPLAGEEIEDAALWYKSQQTGLGKRFTQTVRNEIKFVCRKSICFCPEIQRSKSNTNEKIPFPDLLQSK